MEQKRKEITDKNRAKNQPYDIDVIPPVLKMNKKAQMANWALRISLLLTALAIGTFLYWSFEGDNVLEVKNSPFPTEIIRDGGNGIVLLSVDYCKNLDVDGKLRVSFVGATREVFIPLTAERFLAGCESTSLPIVIPKGIEPGEYSIKFIATYNVNPLKKNVVVEFESRQFELK